MASEYAQQIHEKRHELLQQLVMQIFDVSVGVRSGMHYKTLIEHQADEGLCIVQLDEENMSLALEFCLQKGYYHSFPDVQPSEVEKFYAELVQRFQDDSQLSKASALLALTSRVLAADLQSSSQVPDINHNLLQLLASLAQHPMQSKLQESPELLQLMYQMPAEDAAKDPGTNSISSQLGKSVHLTKQLLSASESCKQSPTVSRFRQLLQSRSGQGMSAADAEDALSAAGSSAAAESEEFDPYAEESDLTDWSSDDGYEPQVFNMQGDEYQLSDHSSPAPAAAAGLALAAAPNKAFYGSAASLQAPSELQPSRAYPSSQQLLMKLSQARLACLPYKVPTLDRCFTEQYLAEQLLRVLQGQQSPAFLLTHDPTVPAAQPADALKTPATMPVGPGAPWKDLVHERFLPDPLVTTPDLSPGTLQEMLAEFADAGSRARQLRQLAQQLTQNSKQRPGASQSVRCSLWQCADASAGAGPITMTSCLRGFGAALAQQLDLMGCQLAQLQGQVALQAGVTVCSSPSHTLTLLKVKQLARPVIRRALSGACMAQAAALMISSSPAKELCLPLTPASGTLHTSSAAAATGPLQAGPGTPPLQRRRQQ
eukprot:gene12731-12861_t